MDDPWQLCRTIGPLTLHSQEMLESFHKHGGTIINRGAVLLLNLRKDTRIISTTCIYKGTESTFMFNLYHFFRVCIGKLILHLAILKNFLFKAKDLLYPRMI